MTNKPRKTITGFGVLMLFVLAGALFFRQLFFTVQVSGNSMYKTFRSGQRLLATSAYWMVGEPRRNDIVVFKLGEKDEPIIKRIFKVGGEEVDWLNAPRNWKIENGPYKVPAGSVYVLGDNRSESEDSRVYGPVERSQILGKVVLAN